MGHYIEVDQNVNVYVEDVGEGTPILFLHGWPVSHKMFEYQQIELPKHGYRFLGMDLRGYGKSDAPWSGYDYDTMAADVDKVVRELDLQDVVLVGFSMGGPIAIRYLANFKENRVQKLVLLGAAAPLFTQRDEYPHGLEKSGVDDIIANLKSDRPGMLKDFGGMFFHQDMPDAFSDWFLNLGLTASPHATIHSAVALRDEDGRVDLASVHVPTLILHGKHDEICPFEFTSFMEEGIPEATVVPFENSGHGLVFEEKEKVNHEILQFLKR
ncbi:alpha/beta fold hydrolase [Alkalicoccobacillus gibsonii]|jgi:pimeloyl-ACP methyl ester carboxylesterase|uniref:alpha/beta fold hydrolase n=1 Tax=Alkalicoccobacillus gibsonii TaxID=79881 RepID=UPI003510E003